MTTTSDKIDRDTSDDRRCTSGRAEPEAFEARRAPQISVTTSAGGVSANTFVARPVAAGPYPVELGAAESLVWTFRLWSESLPRLAALGLVPYLLTIPLLGLGMLTAWGRGGAFDPLVTAAAVSAIVAFFTLLMVASTAGVFHLVDEELHGVSVSPLHALAAGLRHAGWLFVGYVLLAALATVGMAAPMVPMVLAHGDPSAALLAIPAGLALGAAAFVTAARLAPALPAIVVEDLDVVQAIARAWRLTSGRTGVVVSACLLFVFTYAGLSMMAGMVGMLPLVGMLLQIGLNALMLPLAFVFPFVLYAGCVRESAARS